MDPASRLSKAIAHLRGLALEEIYLFASTQSGKHRIHSGNASCEEEIEFKHKNALKFRLIHQNMNHVKLTAGIVRGVDTPFAREAFDRWCRVTRIVRYELRDIKADSTSA